MNAMLPVQKVVEVSDVASSMGFKVGMDVLVNYDNFAVAPYTKDTVKSDMDEYYSRKKRYILPVYDFDGKEYLLVDVHDILFIVEDYEEVDEADLPSYDKDAIVGADGLPLRATGEA